MSELRESISQSLKDSLKQKDERATSTLRLILAALKDRDIAARGKGNADLVSDDEILLMLQTMLKQRRESISMYEQGGRLELAEQEREEIGIIEQFLPKQLSGDDLSEAVSDVISDLKASSLKDMGAVMAELRNRYAGRMDFGAASGIVKGALGTRPPA